MCSLKTKSLKIRFLAYPTGFTVVLHCFFLLNYYFHFLRPPSAIIVITLASFHRMQSLSIKFVMNFLIRNWFTIYYFQIGWLVPWPGCETMRIYKCPLWLTLWRRFFSISAIFVPSPFCKKKIWREKIKSRWSWRCGLKEYRGLCAG